MYVELGKCGYPVTMRTVREIIEQITKKRGVYKNIKVYLNKM